MQYFRAHPEVRGQAFHEFRHVGTASSFERPWNETVAQEFDSGDSDFLVAKHALALHSPNILRRLQQLNPEVRLVVALRDPVKRAYSAFWWARVAGYESEVDFAKALERGPLIGSGENDRVACDYLGNSDYESHFETLVSIFRPDQISVVFDSELRADPQEVLIPLFSKFGLKQDVPVPSISVHSASRARSPRMANFLKSPPKSVKKIANTIFSRRLVRTAYYRLSEANRQEFQPPLLDPALEERLYSHFEPADRALAVRLGRQLPWRG